MSEPDADRLFRVLDATWPPAQFVETGPFLLRKGEGGGQRVSAATATGDVSHAGIDQAETGMREMEQRPLFMVRDGETALDELLEKRRYEMVDPVSAYLAPARHVAKDIPLREVIPSWPPLVVQREIWRDGGIGAGRLAIMERAPQPKTALLARHKDAPVGVAFVGISDGVAMLHALEIAPASRRSGIGAAVMYGAANWALAHGAEWLALMVTRANAPANGLYRKLGMSVATRYHYRRAPEASP